MIDGMSYASIYKDYLEEAYHSSRSDEVGMIREDLLNDFQESPDYQGDAKRNGIPQPMVFTRGGDDHGYNVICLPGDELFAGDIIDAFDEKWLVMRVRADMTTHKVGVMYQCNKLIRFQNFDKEIYERWSYVDVSGYSSSFNRSTSIQNSSEQMVIYMPFDEATEKIYVDKRLALNGGYDRYGRKMLSVLKVTGVNPVAESFNQGDHILMLKVERDLYDEEADNLELEICDYLSDDATQSAPEDDQRSCSISGRTTLRIGKTNRYAAVFTSERSPVPATTPIWSLQAEDGVTLSVVDSDAFVEAEKNDELIGSTFALTLRAEDGTYGMATLEGEVVSLV